MEAEKKILHSYKDLIVWKKSIELVVLLYSLTNNFPKEEIYGLTSQIRRAGVSIPSNIAEGRQRGTRKDFTQFLRIALGSGAELETQIQIAKRLSFGKNSDFEKIDLLLSEVMRMLHAMIQKLSANS